MNILQKIKRRISVWKELSVNHVEIVEEYKNKKESIDFVDKPAPIWVCWLQGEENAPEIVKICIKSIRTRNPNHPIIVVSEQNISEYIKIPEYISQKYKEQKIPCAHYSDYIRCALLAEYGGVWMDATLFCVGELPESCFSVPFFTGIKEKTLNLKRYRGASFGLWVTFFMGSDRRKNIIFSLLRDCLADYWEKNDKVCLYSFFDFFIMFAYFKLPLIRSYIKSYKSFNTNMWKLSALMNKKFCDKKWMSLKSRQYVFKLTYKEKWRKYTKKGEKTYFGAFIEGDL